MRSSVIPIPVPLFPPTAIRRRVTSYGAMPLTVTDVSSQTVESKKVETVNVPIHVHVERVEARHARDCPTEPQRPTPTCRASLVKEEMMCRCSPCTLRQYYSITHNSCQCCTVMISRLHEGCPGRRPQVLCF